MQCRFNSHYFVSVDLMSSSYVARSKNTTTQFSEHSNYATDGHLLARPQDNAEFVLRAMFMACNWTLKLLSNNEGKMDVTSQFDIFRRAFTFDGQICGPWELAPGHRFERGDEAIKAMFSGQDPGTLISQDSVLEPVIEKWDAHRLAIAAHIPFLATKGIETLSGIRERAAGNGMGRPASGELLH